mmetsp:Transcript_34277/g.44218  ORF Transcript_34277/g.44218 Transcript_34277/m.44218 type:complete len:337 (-) Transcript_34277:231-1241(-)
MHMASASFPSENNRYLVVINKATDLRSPGALGRLPNTYAKITCPEAPACLDDKTHILKSTINPVWGECFLVCLPLVFSPVIEISVYHSDDGVLPSESDDLLGDVNLDLSQTLSNNGGQTWHSTNHTLTKALKHDGSRVRIGGILNVLVKRYENPTIKLLCAHKLRNADGPLGRTNPSARIYGLTDTYKVWYETETVLCDFDPVWNEVYTIPLLKDMPFGGALTPCRIEVIDNKNSTNRIKNKDDDKDDDNDDDECLGEVTIPWQTLFPDPKTMSTPLVPFKLTKTPGRSSDKPGLKSTLYMHCSMTFPPPQIPLPPISVPSNETNSIFIYCCAWCR